MSYNIWLQYYELIMSEWHTLLSDVTRKVNYRGNSYIFTLASIQFIKYHLNKNNFIVL